MQRVQTVDEQMAYHLTAIRDQVERMATAHTDSKQAAEFMSAHFAARDHLRQAEEIAKV